MTTVTVATATPFASDPRDVDAFLTEDEVVTKEEAREAFRICTG